jgi:hypothetical protein
MSSHIISCHPPILLLMLEERERKKELIKEKRLGIELS